MLADAVHTNASNEKHLNAAEDERGEVEACKPSPSLAPQPSPDVAALELAPVVTHGVRVFDQGDLAFLNKVDLASCVYGSKVIFATDEWFAPAANMLLKHPAVFEPDVYTEFGKKMDGWESRRKRISGHDFCIIKLGLPGRVRGIEVDTSHFTGNFAPSFSLSAANLENSDTFFEDGQPHDHELITSGEMGTCASDKHMEMVEGLDSDNWTDLVSRTPLDPGYSSSAKHFYRVDCDERFTHIRLNMFPDGGIARLRVYGDVAKDWNSVQGLVDVAASENGGEALGCSDAHFGRPSNLIGPGRAPNMGDGWETARKRNRPPVLKELPNGLLDLGNAHDWAILKLAVRSDVDLIEIDTNHFKGNFPESCVIEGCEFEGDGCPPPQSELWRPLLPRTKCVAHAQVVFSKHDNQVVECGPITHIKITIFPDGGLSRVRVMGHPRLA